MIVPLTAGSPVDVVARLVGNHLAAALAPAGDHREPAGRRRHHRRQVGRHRRADGYTLLHTAANHVIAPAAFKNLTYDPIKDFAPSAPPRPVRSWWW